ncbi:HU domain-containing protein [Mucilaginibacter paludis]|uniref:SPOR domain-containing protein n=1 Tax=Mucilaginibacter paludis DSM 18603 TaxID=714943 RepID=H1XZD7_9SPHI|nr:hypothetical protein [Mucilaginibacter paludis]EHQ25625.1 hypothetical protein Mucpa_1467 [Mucilaginibacter paludis DSM 18603]
MDIAVFISELLDHQKDLVIPGLGSFYRAHVEGYYNQDQQQFYPPTMQLQFSTEQKDDDGKLVGLIAEYKNISIESASYFVDKFVTAVLLQVNAGSFAIGDKGVLSMRRNQLVFISKKFDNNNELFYGLSPVKLKRTKSYNQEGIAAPNVQVPVTEKPSPFTAALLRGETMPDAIDGVEQQQHEPEAETKPRKIYILVLVIALVLLLSGVVLVTAYWLKPELFAGLRGHVEPPPVSGSVRKKIVSDSTENAIQAQKDIGATPVVDSVTKSKIEMPVDTFGIVIGTFKTYNGAQMEYGRYINNGMRNIEIRRKPDDARRYQIDVATYLNIDSANAHLEQFKKKLKQTDIFVQTYPYKKQ